MKPQGIEPQITIDPLEPSGDQWLFAEAMQGDVQARIAVRPHPEYRRGYVFFRTVDRVQAAAPGRMGRKQERHAKALLEVLEERLREQLHVSGWQVVTHTSSGDEVWRYDRPKPAPRSQVVTQARAHGLPAYQRTIKTRLVSFTCVQCGKHVEMQRYPGPLPRYCSENCEQEATRAKTLARVQRFRAKQHKL